MTESWNRIGAKIASPNQISNHINQVSNEVLVKGILECIDPSVSEIFFTNKGKTKAKELNCFERSLEGLMSLGYKPEEIIKLDSNCVRRDGRIDEEKFRHLLHEINSPHSWEGNI